MPVAIGVVLLAMTIMPGYATSCHRATADRCWPRSWRRPSGWPGPGEVRERHRFDADLAWLPEVARRLADPTPLTATVSPALTALHRRIAERTAPTSTGAVRRNGR